jgi:hypothetical protein
MSFIYLLSHWYCFVYLECDFLYISQKLHIYLCPSIAFLLKYDMKDYNDTLYISLLKNSKIKHEISFSHIKWREIKKKTNIVLMVKCKYTQRFWALHFFR